MKKVGKILFKVFLVLVVLIIGLLTYVKLALPNAGEMKEISFTHSDEIVERGRYLANHVVVCVDCHSTRDWTRYSGPVVKGTEGMGGEYFGRNMGLPGEFYAKNITPSNISDWTDSELFHVITTGIDKGGEALFPIMPYKAYAFMHEEDVKSIIAYIRTLVPIKSDIPERTVDFPMNFIINTIPSEATPMKKLTLDDGVKYGEYITTIAGCTECHTPQEKGAKIEGMDYAGGFEFQTLAGILRSPNITPDPTGIADWSKDNFIDRFKFFADTNNIVKGIGEDEFNTIMPWTMYAGMTEEDLGAIYDYLKTIPPVENKVEVFTKK